MFGSLKTKACIEAPIAKIFCDKNTNTQLFHCFIKYCVLDYQVNYMCILSPMTDTHVDVDVTFETKLWL